MPRGKQRAWEDSYEGQLRALVGARPLILPGARAAILDVAGRVLLVRRRDNGRWAMPAGGLELDESMLDCLRREVTEETGLRVEAATLVAIYSGPRFKFQTHYGNPVHMLSHVFRVDRYGGDLVTETDETIDARFFAEDELPDLHEVYRMTLQDLRDFAGGVLFR